MIIDERIREQVLKTVAFPTETSTSTKTTKAEEEEPEQKQKHQETRRLPRLNFFVEGLCWGNEKNIQKVWEEEEKQREINKKAKERAKKLQE